MKKIAGLSFAVLLISLVFSLNALAMDYQHSMELKDMNFSWSIENDLIHVKLSAKTTGWVAVGFNPEKAMLHANIIIGYVKKGKVKIEDHFGNRKRGHSKDKKEGGKNDIQNPAGTEENGFTTLTFTIPLDSGDKTDGVIKADGSNILIFAYGGKRDSTKSRHNYRSTYSVNLKTGENKRITK